MKKFLLNINNRAAVQLDQVDEQYLQIMPVPVNQYPQGLYELYNLSGNAAEMVAEKGSTKGGSYGSTGYYLAIDAEDEFEGVECSPYVGFRYVMDVIEK